MAPSYRKTHWKIWWAKPPTFSNGLCGWRGDQQLDDFQPGPKAAIQPIDKLLSKPNFGIQTAPSRREIHELRWETSPTPTSIHGFPEGESRLDPEIWFPEQRLTGLVVYLKLRNRTPGPEIVHFWDRHGPLLQQNPLEKAPDLFQWVLK